MQEIVLSILAGIVSILNGMFGSPSVQPSLGYSGNIAQPFTITSPTTSNFIGDIQPQTDNFFKVGSVAFRFGTGLFGTSVSADNVTTASSTITPGVLTLTGLVNQGNTNLIFNSNGFASWMEGMRLNNPNADGAWMLCNTSTTFSERCALTVYPGARGMVVSTTGIYVPFGVATTTVSSTFLAINQTNNTFDQGRFNVDRSGNVSASGTITSLAITTSTFKGTLVVSSTDPNNGTSVSTSGKVFMQSISSGLADFVCRNATTGEITDGGAATCAVSSKKFKDNIESVNDIGIAEVMKLRATTWNFKPSYNPDTTKRMSLIAEEAFAVDPTLAGLDKEGNPQNLDPNAMAALAFKAIQEQQKQIDELKAQLKKKSLFSF